MKIIFAIIALCSFSCGVSQPKSKFFENNEETCTIKNSLGWVFCNISGGLFTMGSPLDEVGRENNEGPQHKVVLTSDYEMLSTHVTQAMWQEIMGSNPSYFKDPRNPVEQVSWNDIKNVFLPKLNAKLKSEGYIYRLPTEAEWERAARADTDTPYGTEGNLEEFAWCGANSGQNPHHAGKLKPNPFGLYDMHGNVWQWVEDSIDSYKAEVQIDPVINEDGTTRGIRGGRYGDNNNPRVCRSAFRNSLSPHYRFGTVGFRLVRTL